MAVLAAKPAQGTHQPVSLTDKALNAILGMALLGELVVLFANVVARALGHSLVWSQEIAEIALAVLTFIGGAVAYRRGQHMAVHAVLERLPQSWRPAMAALVDWVICGVALMTTGISLQMFGDHWEQYTPIMGLRQSFIGIPLTVGMLLLACFTLERLWHQPRRIALPTGVAVLALVGALMAAQAFWGPFAQSTTLLVVFAVFAVLLAIGVPIGFVLIAVALLYLYNTQAAPLQAVALSMQGSTASFIMLAVPFFILAGDIMTHGGLSRPLAEAVRALFGRFRGGLLQVIVVTMYVFSGISGAKVADVAAVGATMREMLEEGGYEPAESTAVLAASAIMGETVPPSIAMLVMGSITTVSVGALFTAGLIPAALMGICLMATAYVRSRRAGMLPGAPVARAVMFRSVLGAIPALLVPVILIAGIMTGMATPTEVSSFAVVYALLVALLSRNLNLGGFWHIMAQAGSMAGMILFIIAAGTVFSWTLTIASLPDLIAGLLTAIGGSQVLFLIGSIFVLVLMGSLLEGLPALLIFGPLLVPVARQFGVDTLQFAIVLIFAMGMGAFAPPIGVGMYVACSVGGTTMEAATKRMLPYLAVLLVGLCLVAFVPWFSLVVPHLLHMGG